MPPRRKFRVPALLLGAFIAGLIVSGIVYYFITYWPPGALQEIESGFVYLRASSTGGQIIAEVVVSNNSGSLKKVIQTIPNYIPEDYPDKSHDVAEERGLIVYKITQEKSPGIAEASLWISDKGQKPEKILTLPEGRFFQEVIISSDGERIAYSLIHQNEDLPPELWLIKPDGSDNKMVVERLEQTYGVNFKLLDFTKNEGEVFLQLDDPDRDVSAEIFTADLRTGRINSLINLEDVLLSQEIDGSIEAISFSPDRTKLALSVVSSEPTTEENDYISQENAIIYTYDLRADTLRPLYPASVGVGNYGYVSIRNLFWSDDNNRLLYSVEVFMPEIKIVDIRSERQEPVVLVKAPAESLDIFVTPLGWVSEDRIAYVEDRSIAPNSNEFRTNLYTIRIDGLDRKLIDSAAYRTEVLKPLSLFGSFGREADD